MGVNFKLHATVSKTGKRQNTKEKTAKLRTQNVYPKRFNIEYVLNDGGKSGFSLHPNVC